MVTIVLSNSTSESVATWTYTIREAGDCRLAECRITCDVAEALCDEAGEWIVFLGESADISATTITRLLDECDNPAVSMIIGVDCDGREKLAGISERFARRMLCGVSQMALGVSAPEFDIWAVRRSVLENNTVSASNDHRAFAVRLLATVPRQQVVEVSLPAVSVERGYLRNALTALVDLLEHRYAGWFDFLRFGLVGGSGVVVNLAAFTWLRMQFVPGVALALAIWLAMSWNFLLNRRFTFRQRGRESIVKQYAGFCASCLLGAGVNWTTSVSLIAGFTFFSSYETLASCIGILAGMLLNFEMCRRFVFRRGHSSKSSGQVQKESVATETPSLHHRRPSTDLSAANSSPPVSGDNLSVPQTAERVVEKY